MAGLGHEKKEVLYQSNSLLRVLESSQAEQEETVEDSGPGPKMLSHG